MRADELHKPSQAMPPDESESRELARAEKRDPEVDSVAAGCVRNLAGFRGDVPQRRQIGRLPERQEPGLVRDQDVLSIESRALALTESVAGESRQQRSGRRPHDECGPGV